MTPSGSRLRLLARLAVLIVVNLVLVPLYALCIGPARRLRRPVQVAWCRLLLRFSGIRVRLTGAPASAAPTMFVGNHVSYLDIPLVSAFVRASFVAKSDVAGWPLFGFIAKVTGTIFVERVGSAARLQQSALDGRLAAGENLVIFPEGTTSDGSSIMPFKTSLFSIAGPAPGRPAGITVQPFSIAYTSTSDGTPLNGPLASLYCWFGEAELMPHMLRMLSLPGAVAELRFHAPIDGGAVRDRKLLARLAENAVAEGVGAAHGAAAANAIDGPVAVSSSRREAAGAECRSALSDP